jgi:hypothetical protein
MENLGPSTVAPTSPPSILTPETAKKQMTSFVGYAVSMIEHLHQQNASFISTQKKVEEIYTGAKKEIEKVQSELETSIERISQTMDIIPTFHSKNTTGTSADKTVATLKEDLTIAKKLEGKQEQELEKQQEAIDVREKLQKARLENKQNEEQFQNLDKKLDQFNKKKVDNKSNIQRLEGDLKKAKLYEEALKQQLEIARIQETKTKENYKKSEKEITRLEKINLRDRETQNQLGQARLNEQTIRGEKIQQQTRIEGLEQDLRENKNKITELEGELKASKKEESDYSSTLPKLTKEFDSAQKKFISSREEVDSLEKKLRFLQTNLSQKDIKTFGKELKKAEEEIVKIIRQTQLDVVFAIGQEYAGPGESKEKFESLAKGGWGARKIHLHAVFSKRERQVVEAFRKAKGLMDAASKTEISSPENESEIESDKRAEFESYRTGKSTLARRAGVIGLNSIESTSRIYRIQPTFSKQEIREQLDSFTVQNISDIQRVTIENTIEIGNQTYTNDFIPLNQEFDLFLGKLGLVSNVFKNIFGTKGISSGNRQETRLVNSFITTFSVGDKTLFSAIRHAIISDKYEKDATIRATNSRKSAEDLIKAAILNEIASQGLNLEQAREKGITLNLNSVSLVTPDSSRSWLRRFLQLFGKGKGIADEKAMLNDQIEALHHFNGEHVYELDGFLIRVNVKINTFNFGVNAGAKGIKDITIKGKKIPLPTIIRVGLTTQYEHNLKAMLGFRKQVEDFYEQVNDILKKSQDEINKPTTFIPELEKAKKNAELLMKDIELLMADKEAYLEGDNQYEIQAKILCLSNLMNQAIKSINDTIPEKHIPGIQCAFNCMSDKDRSGIMDGIAKTFAAMAHENDGIYPSHEDLMRDSGLRKQFTDILVPLLLKGGGLKITQWNNKGEAIGYKVKEEARIFNIPLEQFLQIQGFSITSSS